MTLIRPRQPGDLPALAEALAQVHRADGYPSRWPDDPVGFLTPRRMLGAWVVAAGGPAAGHVALSQEPFPGPRQPGRTVAVNRLFVAPAARGRGVAGLLLTAAMDEAARTGAGLWLEVTAGSDAAVALYVRHGWRYVGQALASWGDHPVVRRYLGPDPPSA
jgi:GNAT superfamily N-acetyltransferase